MSPIISYRYVYIYTWLCIVTMYVVIFCSIPICFNDYTVCFAEVGDKLLLLGNHLDDISVIIGYVVFIKLSSTALCLTNVCTHSCTG